MNAILKPIFCSAVTAVFLLLISVQSIAAQELEKTLTPFFKNHCLRCHGPDDEQGQVRVDRLEWNIDNNDTAQRWQDLLDVLNSGDMPPEYEDQPEPEELIEVLRVLTRSIEDARKRLSDTGGEIAMRRLNRREYAGTVRELFGFKLPLGNLPPDSESDAFDTSGADQFFTSSHFETYLELNTTIIQKALALARRPRKERTTIRREPEDTVNEKVKKKLDERRRKMALINQGKSWKEAGFADEGEMKIFVSRAKKEMLYETYLGLSGSSDGQYFTTINETRSCSAYLHADPRAEYRFRVHGGIRKAEDPLHGFLQVRNRGEVSVLKLSGTVRKPETVDVYASLPFGKSGVLSLEFTPLHPQSKKYDTEGDWGAQWIDYVEIDGPIYPKQRTFFEQLLYPKPPGKKGSRLIWNDDNAGKLIRRFGVEAFRGSEPSKEFINKLEQLYKNNRKDGLKFHEAIVEPLAIVLASPQFLFVQERVTSEERRTKLTDRELAIRLAYFLWSSPPDKKLFSIAKKGKLSDDATLREQVVRMLDDPKADAFYEGFVSQWVELERFDAITVDTKVFPEFSEGLRHSARREVVEFFKHLVKEDLPVDNLIDSDFVIVNPLLQHHYQLPSQPAIEGNEFVKVSLPSDSVRGGLLGQMAVLTLGSNGERSSPVIRGAWVMEKLLHDPPSPPPPNVPELGSVSEKPLTNRQMVIRHQQQVVCASCHKRMDVIGFGLENFDTIGRWRRSEQVGKKKIKIEQSGTLPSGVSFKGVHELKSLLMTQKHRLAQELGESLMAYGIGRSIEFSDSQKLKSILKQNWTDDLRLRALICEIVTSPLFRSK